SPACAQERACCGNACVNTYNDPQNCGGCGVVCSGSTSYCDSGSCTEPPCTRPGGSCAADGGSGSCCGSQCCTDGQICCEDEGPVSGEPTCFTPTADQPTCPQGCAPLCVSDRDAKTNITPVHDRDVLDALASVPMSTWSYKTDDPSVRHLGPMAQDLHAAFGLGATDRGYDPIDAHGIAFASVKALYDIAKEQDARIERLEKENARLEKACGAATPATRR
ncbi:MAG: tail fiber domain-containing protein, partial [Polyangiaceae bacterium]